MKIKVFVYEKEYKAVLTDGNRPKIINWYEKISDVYEFANWTAHIYDTIVDVEFVK